MIVRSAVSSFCLAGRSGGRTVRTRQGSYIVFRARSNGGARSRSSRSRPGKGENERSAEVASACGFMGKTTWSSDECML